VRYARKLKKLLPKPESQERRQPALVCPGKGVMGDGKVGGRRRKTVQARPASSGGKA
jgi:hypothetical protein